MNPRFMRAGVAIAATVLVQVASGKERDAPILTPPRITVLPESFDECRVKLEDPVYGQTERSAQFTITEVGSVEKSSLPDGSPDWMKELSTCALRQLRFTPATRDGVPVKRGASLNIRFQALSGDQSGTVVIDKVGPLITPPMLKQSVNIDSCFPRRKVGGMSRFVVTVTVLPDGSATNLEMPLGSESWHEESARCIFDRLDFTPGSLDGLPVEAQAKIPIVLLTDGDSASTPSLRSTTEELEAAYRACYPANLLTMTSAFYSFDITPSGRLANPKVAKSSGDPRLDEAGQCILKMLEFTPMMQNGHAIRSNVTWELPIRPPR